MAEIPEGFELAPTAPVPEGFEVVTPTQANTPADTAAAPRSFVQGVFEGIPIAGPTLLNAIEFLRAKYHGRTIEEIEAETQRIFEANPNLRTAGNVTGSILATAPLGAGSVGTALFSTVPRAIATGGVISGVDVAARGGSPFEVATGTALGAAGGAAGGLITRAGAGVVARLKGGIGSTELSNFVRSASDDLKAAASSLYSQADAVGVKLGAKTFNRMIGRITKAAIPKGNLADNILVNTPKAAGIVKWLQGLRGREPTLSEIDQVRQFIGDVAGSSDAGERRLGKLMVDALDDALGNLTNANFAQAELKGGISALETARGLWSRGKIIETISDAVEKAEIANQPLGQAIQGRVRTLLGNKKFTRGLAPNDKTALRAIVKSGEDSMLATLGQFRTQTGSISIGAAAGGLADSFTTGGLVAGGVAAGGSAARGLRSVLAQQRLRDAVDAITLGKQPPKFLPEALGGAVGAGAGIGLDPTIVGERKISADDVGNGSMR